MTEAEKLVSAAWAAFDYWLSNQTDEVQELSLLEQTEAYSLAMQEPGDA